MNYEDTYRYENVKRGDYGFPVSLYKLGGDVFIHRHDAIEIIYATNGSSLLTIGGSSIVLLPGVTAFVNSNVIHCIKASEAFEGYALVFEKNFLSLSDRDEPQLALLKPLIMGRYYLPETFDASKRIERILSYFKPYKTTDRMRIKLELLKLICDIDDAGMLLDTCPGSVSSDIVNDILSYIHNHFRENISLKDISQSSNLSLYYLCRIFKSCTGETVFHYLTRLRIDHAKLLLSTCDITITEVALESGFDTITPFIRAFRNETGITPFKWSKLSAKNKTIV